MTQRQPSHSDHASVRPALVRAVPLFGLWVIMTGTAPADLLVGVGVAALATRLSLDLLPPTSRRYDQAALVRLVIHFLYQSVVAGLDVARRAFDPRLPLRPGFVTYPARSPSGLFRSVFTAWTSLQPGTLPTGRAPAGGDAARGDERGIVYHALDIDIPVVDQLAAAEATLARVVRDVGGP
ncbi:Na+/H+ antiporter subunit E [Rhodoplanes azumiensis]|uniref:Na+/H+ antiporter subunit E n=1 Tax=Rhodoplanes azumiensis TaxID=1897628 RepID=A0ABW5AM28_9BRAD